MGPPATLPSVVWWWMYLIVTGMIAGVWCASFLRMLAEAGALGSIRNVTPLLVGFHRTVIVGGRSPPFTSALPYPRSR